MPKIENAGKYILGLRDSFVKRVTSQSMIEQDSLTYWRINILFSIVLIGLALIPFALIAGLMLVIEEKIWNVLLSNMLAYVLCIFIMFSRRPGYITRASIPSLTCYLVGLAIILYVGPLSSGPIYLFTFPILVGIFLGARASLLAIAINCITLIIIAWFISTGRFGQDFPFFISNQALITAIVNFIILNLLTSLSVTVLVKGLISSHLKEKDLASNLDKKHKEVLAAKEKLEHEVKEREQAEHALRESEEKYRVLAENATDIIWTMDMDLQYTYFSPSIERLQGFTPEEALTRTVEESLTSDSYQKAMKALNDELERHHRGEKNSEQSITMPLEVTRKDGSTVMTEIKANFIYDPDYQPIGVIGITRDITERIQAEMALQDERNTAQTYLDIAGVIFVAINKEEVVTLINKKGCEILGYSEEEIIGKNWFDNFIPGGVKEDLLPVSKRLLNGEIESAEYYENPILTKTGEERMIAWHNTVIRDNEGNIIGHLSSGTDITESKHAEAILKESEEKFRGLAENSFDIIYMTDETGVVTYVSPSCENIFQYKPSEVEGRNFLDFLPENEKSRLLQRFSERLQGIAGWNFEFEGIKKDGKKILAELNSSLIFKDGKVVGTQGIIRDISQRKEMEAHILQTQKMESMGTLAGGIAHDFNNILGIILGNTDLAIDEVPQGSPARDFLKEIRVASLRARDVVKQILSLARKSPMELKPIKISNNIKESLRLLRTTIPATIEIHQNILCESEMILADPTEINQLLINLCTNSVQAMEEDIGKLDIYLEPVSFDDLLAARYKDLKAGEYVKLTVRDEGHGIDPEILDRVFDPYFTTKDVNKGTGMGLAVVYGIIKKHNGAIKVSNRPFKGTIVEVLFPIIEGETEIEDEDSEDLPFGTERVLFVEDEESLVQAVRLILERQGYTVTVRVSSKEALTLFKKNPSQFDLVITDMAMPKMAGDRLARELTKIRPDIPIILGTGYSWRIDAAKAQEMGIKAFIMKPFEKEDLLKTVRKVLDNKL